MQNHTLSATIATRSWSCVCIALRFGIYGWYLIWIYYVIYRAWLLRAFMLLKCYGLSLGRMFDMHFDLWWGLTADPQGLCRGQSLCVGMLSREFDKVYWLCSSEYPNGSLEAFNLWVGRLRNITVKQSNVLSIFPNLLIGIIKIWFLIDHLPFQMNN